MADLVVVIDLLLWMDGALMHHSRVHHHGLTHWWLLHSTRLLLHHSGLSMLILWIGGLLLAHPLLLLMHELHVCHFEDILILRILNIVN